MKHLRIALSVAAEGKILTDRIRWKIAGSYAQVGAFAEAKSMADKLPESGTQFLRWQIADCQAKAGDLAGAMETGKAIHRPTDRRRLWESLGTAHVRVGKLDELRAWIGTLEPDGRPWAYLGAAKGFLPVEK